MKKLTRALWGILLLALGVLMILRAMDLLPFELFFEGWWTLFLILPAAIGLLTEKDKVGNLTLLAVGVFLLLACRDVVSFSMVWKLVLAVCLLAVGAHVLWGGIFGKRNEKRLKRMRETADSSRYRNAFALFSGNEQRIDGEIISGANLTAIFGGVEMDLRGAIIPENAEIRVTCLFGGIDLFLPEDVKIRVESLTLFGGVSDKRRRTIGEKNITVYVTGLCLFGGVDIK